MLAVNQALDANPEKVNAAPYTEGWMLKLQLTDPTAPKSLLSADEYAKTVG